MYRCVVVLSLFVALRLPGLYIQGSFNLIDPYGVPTCVVFMASRDKVDSTSPPLVWTLHRGSLKLRDLHASISLRTATIAWP